MYIYIQMCIYIPYHIISMKKAYSMTECEFVYLFV